MIIFNLNFLWFDGIPPNKVFFSKEFHFIDKRKKKLEVNKINLKSIKHHFVLKSSTF